MKQIPALFFAILLLWSAPQTAQAQEALSAPLDHLLLSLRQGFRRLQAQNQAATPKPGRKTGIVAPRPPTQTSVVIRKPVPSHQSTAPKPPTSPSYTPPDLSGTVAKVVGALQTMQPTLSKQEIDQAPLGAAQVLGANITVEGPSLSERFAGFLRRVVGLERARSRATADIETSGIPASSILSIPGPAGAGSAINIWHDATSARIGTVRGSESDITINPDGGQVFVAGDLAVSSVLSGMSYEGVIWGRALILNGGELDPNVFVVRATGGKTLFNINTKTEEITINAPVTINAPLQAINITGETQGGGGGGAPTDAGYLLAAADPTLTGERVLSAGSNIVLTDNGADGTFVVSTAASPTFSGTVSAGSFSGSGTGLTNIPDSAFSGNVALLNRASQTFTGVIRAGSGNIAITTSAGNLAASALGLISGDGTGATSSGSGLEVDTDRLGLLQGCSDGQIVKWVDASNIWQCSADAGAAGASLQGSYDAGNTITTTDNRNIAITLADTTTDSNFTITVASGSTSTVSITRPDAGVGEAAPAQFLLIENLDANVGVAAAVKIQAAAGGITTALDVSDAEIVNAINVGDNVILGTTATIDFTNFDVSGAGAITAASLNAGAGTIQTTGTITGGTVNATTAIQTGGTTRISASGDLVSIGNLTATGAITISSGGAGALNLDSASGTVTVGAGDTFTTSGAVNLGDGTGADTITLSRGTGQINFAGFNCTTFSNGGALTTDASGNVSCSADDGGGASAWSALTDPTASLTLNHTATGQFTTTMNWTATGALNPWTHNLTNNAGAATAQNAFRIINADTSQTVDVNTESLLVLDNADTSTTGSTVVDNAILITASGTVANAITDAIDVSDADIVNALNVGDNTILGTTAVIDFTNFDVTGAGAVTAASTITGTTLNATTALQTGGTTRVDSSGNLVSIGNLTATGAITIASTGAGNDIIINGADILDVQDATTFASTITVNGLATFNTDVDLILAETENLVITNTATGTTAVDLISATLTNNTTSGTQRGQVASIGGSGVTESGLTINYTGTVASGLTAGIIIAGTSTGTIATALDLSDAEIGTGISLAANDITGTTAAITFTNFSVSTAGAIVGVGVNSGTGLLQGTGGLTLTGAVSVNTSGANATNIGTGTNTGTITLGNAAGGDLALNDLNWSVTGPGAATFVSVTSPTHTGAGAVTVSSGGAGGLTLDSASNTIILAATDTTLQRTAAGTFTIDLSDAANTILFVENTGAGAANLRVSGLVSCDTIDTNASGNLVCGTDAGAAGSSLQAAYDAGNTITTSSARDIAITLADTVTDSNFTVTIADASTSTVSISRASGAGLADPAQLLLLDNLDLDRAVADGLKIQAAAGGITDGLDVSDAELVNALNIGSNDILSGGVSISSAELNLLDGHDVALVDTNDAVATAIIGTGALGSGSITAGFGSIDVGADAITTTGTITGGTINATTALQTAGTTRVDSSGNLVSIGNISGVGAVTLSSGGAGALTLDSASNTLIVAATDTTLQRTAVGVYTIDLSDAADTTLFLSNSNVGAGIDALLRVDSLISCDTIDTNASGVFACGVDATGGAASLQAAYDGGNTLTTTTARDIAFTLADSAADSVFTITTATGATGQTRLILADGLGTTPPAELLLIDQQDVNLTVANGITIQAAAGGVITDGVDVADAEIVNAVNVGDNTILGLAAVIDFTNFDVSGAGAVVAVGVNSGTGLLQGTGGLTITGAVSLTGATNVNTSGANATNIGTGTNTGTITIGNAAGGDLALNDGQWSITGAGAATVTDVICSSASCISSGEITANTIDWTDIADATTLDAATTIASTLAGTALDLNESPAGTALTPIALEITPTWGIDIADQTLIGLNINANTNANTDAGDVLQAINIAGITATAGAETAINIGTGWDVGINANANIITNIGNAGTDFIATTGGLTLAGTLTINSDATIALPAGTVDFTVSGLDADSTVTFSGLNSCDTIDTTAGGVLVCGTDAGAAGSSLQAAYDAGNTITTTSARDIAFTLADTVTDSNLTITTATGSTSQTRYILADGLGTTPPAELILIDQQDVNLTVANGLTIQAATGGAITDAIDVADAEIVNALNVGDNTILGLAAVIDFTNFDVTGAGAVTAASTVTAPTYTGVGAVTLSSGGAGGLTLDSASNTLVIAASDTTLSRTAAGVYTLDLVDAADTTLFLTNSNVGAGIDALLRVDSLISCDTIDTNASGVFTCGTDATGGAASLQAAYDGGNIITTTDARDIDLVLANTTTDSNFDIDIAADSTSTVSISRLDGLDTAFPTQLLLLENLDITGTVANGLLINVAAGGAITDAIDVSDPEIVNALVAGANDLSGTSWSITGSSGAAVFVGVNSGTGLLQGTGGLTISGAATFNGVATFNTDVDFTLAEAENIAITNTATGTTAVDLISATLTNNTTSGAQNAQLVSIGGSGTTESAMTVNYTGTVAAGLTAGILIQGTSTGTIATALDVSDVEINTAISVGDNPIQGGALAMQGSTTAALTAQSGNVTIASTGAGNDIVLTPVDRVDITGGGILQVSTITSTGALAISSGGTNTDVTINAIGTGNVLIGNSVLGGLVRIGDATNNVTFAATSREPTLNGTARHTRRITLTPEYPGASLTGDGITNTGTMTSDNTTASASNFRNFYKWTSTGTNDYDIWVSIPLPADFSAMAGGGLLSIDTFSSDITNGTIVVTAYDTGFTASVNCTSSSFTPTVASTWQPRTDADCLASGAYSANGIITLQIKLQSPASGDTRVSNIYFEYLSKW